MPEEAKRSFVYLLEFNTSDLVAIAKKLKVDQEHWPGSKCTFLAVSGEHDIIAVAEDGTPRDALKYAAYLTQTGRYKTTTLTAYSLDEFVAAVIPNEPNPKRK